MADPISIIGLVSGVITFVDFGLKIVSQIDQIRDSAAKGTSDEIDDLDEYIEDVRHWTLKVEIQQKSGLELSQDEKRILKLVQQCEALVKELHGLIITLQVQAGVRSKTWEATKVAFRRRWKQRDLEKLELKLRNLDGQIREHVENAMQLKSTSSIMAKLNELENSQEAEKIRDTSHLMRIREDILNLTKQTKEDMQKWDSAQAARLTGLRIKFEMLQREQASCSFQIEILKSLHYPEIRRRWYQIREASNHSDRWIYDSQATTFVSWLESQQSDDGLYYISGKAGSGKSVLMKSIFENPNTTECLKKWAEDSTLHQASFYFWNQGTDMQKSGVGLFQSLLYQILRSTPDLIQSVCTRRLHHEPWTMKELHDTFKRIEHETRLDAKYCFFVDGLDEYDGDEADVLQLLKALSISGRIKICVSSRPGRQYEDFLHQDHRTFDISHYTRDDMRRHVDESLRTSSNWNDLVVSNPTSCQEIIEEISARANGVWLWVSLVTGDIVKEADKNEKIETLRDILAQTPEDLEEYFQIMIEKIPKRHRQDMARIFLLAVEEVQPLPLYAFALLEKEKEDIDHALNSRIEPINETDILLEYPALKRRIRNRCSDLLIVDDEPHPVFLMHSVDFLHRTVRDFLRDYDKQLKVYLKEDVFDPLVSLSKICLGLLKGLPVGNFRDVPTVNKIIGLTDELLYYAREAEIRSKTEQQAHLTNILDELDRVNSYHARGINNHWTHARDSPKPRGFEEFREGGKCNFLALAVQARLVKYVREKLQADPRRMEKEGRPLLDYALRPRRVTPISMPFHHIRDDPSVSVDMVRLLLSPEYKADPNQIVRLNGDRSVWALFLISINETHHRESRRGSGGYQNLIEAWYETCELLVRAGARKDCLSSNGIDYASGQQRIDPADASSILERVFGRDRAAMLIKEMEEQEANNQGSSCTVM